MVATLSLSLVVVVTGGVGLAGVVAVASITFLSADLPDPSALQTLTFSQPTVVYDRSGSVELGRFQSEDRAVVAFPDVPELVLDATIVAEDRTFWENDGFDLTAMIAAAVETVQGDGRGASTITQQLVRARLLPEEVVAPDADVYLRKAKEIIQSARLTETFPGQTGKQQIIAAYLNEIYYGHGAYGIKAAAKRYFGVGDLADLTPAQAALLAGLPQSPSVFDPYRYAVTDAQGRLVVPENAAPVVRRDWILRNLNLGRWTHLSDRELAAALAEPVVLAGDQPLLLRAPHFTWQVRRQLEQVLGQSADIETGGYRVITTLDWGAQELAEKWLAASAIAPNLSREDMDRLLDELEIESGDRRWIERLRGKDLHNAALVALDYRTGDVIAYAGSAGYYRDALAGPKFDPKYDAAGTGARQPGSAFKPLVYATAFESRALTPGSLLLDITTEFDPRAGWAPRNADRLDRGPVLVRDALQYSLNIPAIRALHRVGNETVADQAEALGLQFAGGRGAFLRAGLAGAIGTVEVRPLDLTNAYATLANGGVRNAPRMILEVRDASGAVIWSAGQPDGVQAISRESAFLVTDILAGNTDPRENPIWAAPLQLRNGPDGQRRPAAVKTGTANDARDLATYGYLAPPEDPAAPALAIGIWMGNSDHSSPDTRQPATSLTAAAPLWQAFVRQLTHDQPVTDFARPEGLVAAKIDAFSGGRPGAWTRETRSELFLDGTQPGARGEVDEAGLLYVRACGGWRVDPLRAEPGPAAWHDDVTDWAKRARRGPGVVGPFDTRTAYFWERNSWGGPIVGPCPKPKPEPTPAPTPDPGGGNGGGGGGGGNPKPPPEETAPPAESDVGGDG